jgi:hypothetical protein
MNLSLDWKSGKELARGKSTIKTDSADLWLLIEKIFSLFSLSEIFMLRMKNRYAGERNTTQPGRKSIQHLCSLMSGCLQQEKSRRIAMMKKHSDVSKWQQIHKWVRV